MCFTEWNNCIYININSLIVPRTTPCWAGGCGFLFSRCSSPWVCCLSPSKLLWWGNTTSRSPKRLSIVRFAGGRLEDESWVLSKLCFPLSIENRRFCDGSVCGVRSVHQGPVEHCPGRPVSSSRSHQSLGEPLSTAIFSSSGAFWTVLSVAWSSEVSKGAI